MEFHVVFHAHFMFIFSVTPRIRDIWRVDIKQRICGIVVLDDTPAVLGFHLNPHQAVVDGGELIQDPEPTGCRPCHPARAGGNCSTPTVVMSAKTLPEKDEPLISFNSRVFTLAPSTARLPFRAGIWCE